jgi:tetratricopeptide (TPR) repeat protein
MKKLLTLPIFVVLLSFLPVLSFADPLKKAESLRQSKKYEEALKVLNEFLKKQPEDVEAQEAVQEILLSQRKEEEVIAEYKARFEKNRSALNAHLYGKLLESPSEREALFREARDSHPRDIWGYVGLANALLDQDRLQEATEVAREGVTHVTKPARLHYVAARVYRRMKEFGKAVTEARLALKADPSDEDYKVLVNSYEWIEISETEDPNKKFALAQKYYRKYKDQIENAEDFNEAMSLAELAFIFAENDISTTRQLVKKAQKATHHNKSVPDAEDKELYARVNSSLFALQALGEAVEGNKEKALKLIKQASSAGEGSEAYYFLALTYDKLGDKNAAIQEAIKASVYPPPYSKASPLSERLWKEVHGSDTGYQEAMIHQKKAFASQRKSRVMAQMISEDHPEFTMEDSNGAKITRQDMKGKVVLMNFWAVWCPPCREELPHWNAFYAKHRNDTDLALVAVGDEPWETMTNYMKNQRLDFPVYRNEDYWEQFDVSGIPTLLVIDPNGKIRFRNVGFEEGTDYEETLEWQIEAAQSK